MSSASPDAKLITGPPTPSSSQTTFEQLTQKLSMISVNQIEDLQKDSHQDNKPSGTQTAAWSPNPRLIQRCRFCLPPNRQSWTDEMVTKFLIRAREDDKEQIDECERLAIQYDLKLKNAILEHFQECFAPSWEGPSMWTGGNVGGIGGIAHKDLLEWIESVLSVLEITDHWPISKEDVWTALKGVGWVHGDVGALIEAVNGQLTGEVSRDVENDHDHDHDVEMEDIEIEATAETDSGTGQRSNVEH